MLLHLRHGPRLCLLRHLHDRGDRRRRRSGCGGLAGPRWQRRALRARTMSFAAWTMFGLFFLWSFLGMPIGHAMLASAIVYLFMTGQDIALVATPEPERALRQLRAAGRAALHPRRRDHERRADLTERMFGFANLLVGRFRGGLAHVNIVASMIFSGMSGSGAGRRGRARQARSRHDGEGRLLAGLLRGALLHLGDHRADHPAVDPDGALRRRLQHLDRLPLHRRRHSRPAARGRRRWAWSPGSRAPATSRSSRRRRFREAVRITVDVAAGAVAAGDPARRHLFAAPSRPTEAAAVAAFCALMLAFFWYRTLTLAAVLPGAGRLGAVDRHGRASPSPARW